MLVPTWMCHPDTFDAAIVSDPVIELAALKQLLILVETALTSLDNEFLLQENQDAENAATTSSVSRRRGLEGPAAQRDVGER